MIAVRRSLWLLTLVSAPLFAELPDEEDWELENGYDTDLLFLHALANYSFDLEWQFDWERRRFADNALRINTGSVSSDELLTDVDLNINEALNDKWRFFGQFTRQGFRRRPLREDQLLLGLERSLFESSAIYVGANPEFGKEFLDIEAGYGWYADNREQYVRLGVRLIDTNWTSKNQEGGSQEQDPIKAVWTARLALGGRTYLYTEGKFGPGFERVFPDPDESPELSRHDRREDQAEVRLTLKGDENRLWSVMLEYYNFEELKTFRVPGFDYDYENEQVNVGLEHVRYFGERHRLRLLAQFVDVEASSRGFRQHDYSRQDVIGGAFYEYLWPQSAVMVAYAAGRPDIRYESLVPEDSYDTGDFTDKLIVGWRFSFSDNAIIRFSLSQEVSEQGFGGGAVQYQMFF